MEDPEDFAEGLDAASRYSMMLTGTYDQVREFARQRMRLAEATLPAARPE